MSASIGIEQSASDRNTPIVQPMRARSSSIVQQSTIPPHPAVGSFPPQYVPVRRASEAAASSAGPPLSAVRHRRRGPAPDGTGLLSMGGSKIGPQRTTKNVQKLKILPFPEHPDDEESGRDVYSQVTRIKDTTARRDAERLGKAERAHLPRVTAYCTANAYKMDGLMRYLKARTTTRGTNPKQFDECIYTPFSYSYMPPEQRQETSGSTEPNLIDLHGSEEGSRLQQQDQQHGEQAGGAGAQSLETSGAVGGRDAVSAMQYDDDDRHSVMSIVKAQPQNASEVFLFNYGVVVIWGMTMTDEKRFLKELARFETEKLSDDDVQVENFNYYITDSYQSRIYNDFITLKDGRNYMIKVAISHAIAQSVKISLFEDLVENTIEETKGIPQEIATTGKVKMGRRTIMMHIGELFILRINVNLQGSVLDSPELMWAEPELEPTYAAARSYLEIGQRVSLLNQRLDVIGDLLQMLKEQLSHAHGEYLEWIVIILIAAEIFVGLVNIAVDILAEGAE